MATEVNQALATYAEGLFDQAAGRGQGAIDQVQADLEQFARLLVHQVRLRKVLADPGLPVANKQALVADLLEGRVSDRCASLVDLLVELNEGHGLDIQLKEWAEVAAARRNRVVAEVRSAVELDEARRVRLAEVLTRVIGKPVLLQTTVDKAILGSLVVRVGDELFDGSIRSRLEQAREALGVA